MKREEDKICEEMAARVFRCNNTDCNAKITSRNVRKNGKMVVFNGTRIEILQHCATCCKYVLPIALVR